MKARDLREAPHLRATPAGGRSGSPSAAPAAVMDRGMPPAMAALGRLWHGAPLILLAVAWLVGVVVADLWTGAAPELAPPAFGAAALCLVLACALWPDRRARALLLLVGILWLGLARALGALPPATPPPGSLRALNVDAASARLHSAFVAHLRGTVLADSEPARGGRASQVRVATVAVQISGAWRGVAGGVLVTGVPLPPLQAGDTVEFSGVLQDPPAVPGFDYAAWLARQGIESYVDRATLRVLGHAAPEPGTLLARWRREAAARTVAMLPEPEAGLLRATLLGQAKAVSPPLRQAFATSGTSWLIVISGMHLGILLGFLFLTLRRLLAPWPSVVLAGAAAGAYATFVGLGVPVARAALMAGLVLLAQGLGRPALGLNLLAVAALVLTALDPAVVADVGFQLSFAAVAGILLLAPGLATAWRRIPLVGEASAVAVAVQLVTWPLVALQFGQFPLLSVPAGVLGGLLLEPVMVIGGLQELAAWLWAPLGQVLAWICWLPLALLTGIVEGVASVTPRSTPLDNLGVPAAGVWYALLAAFALLRWRGKDAAAPTVDA